MTWRAHLRAGDEEAARRVAGRTADALRRPIDIVAVEPCSDPGQSRGLPHGFATDYIFSDSQQTATDVRRNAKRAPGSVVRPRPCHQVMLIDAEHGDDRLATEHRLRGWPARLTVAGEPHDYVVLDEDENVVERSIDMSLLGKERAIRRLGTTEVQAHTMAIDPGDLLPPR
jgi:hypothetical protein